MKLITKASLIRLSFHKNIDPLILRLPESPLTAPWKRLELDNTKRRPVGFRRFRESPYRGSKQGRIKINVVAVAVGESCPVAVGGVMWQSGASSLTAVCPSRVSQKPLRRLKCFAVCRLPFGALSHSFFNFVFHVVHSPGGIATTARRCGVAWARRAVAVRE